MPLVTASDAAAFLGPPVTATDRRLLLALPAAEAMAERYCGREFSYARRAEYYSGTGSRVLALRRRPARAVYEVKLATGLTSYEGFSESAFSSATALTADRDYALWRDGNEAAGPTASDFGVPPDAPAGAGLLVRFGVPWPVGVGEGWSGGSSGQVSRERGQAFGNVRVEYAAGWLPGECPADLQAAVVALAAHLMRVLPYGGLGVLRERLGRWEYELAGRVPGAGANAAGVPDLIAAMLTPYREVNF